MKQDLWSVNIGFGLNENWLEKNLIIRGPHFTKDLKNVECQSDSNFPNFPVSISAAIKYQLNKFYPHEPTLTYFKENKNNLYFSNLASALFVLGEVEAEKALL